MIAETIAIFRERWQIERDAARAKLNARGLDIIGPITTPPTSDDLGRDFWWYSGMLNALDDLQDELDDAR